MFSKDSINLHLHTRPGRPLGSDGYLDKLEDMTSCTLVHRDRAGRVLDYGVPTDRSDDADPASETGILPPELPKRPAAGETRFSSRGRCG